MAPFTLQPADESPEAWLALGERYERAGRPDAALESYRRGLNRQPEHGPLLLRAGLLLLQRGHAEQALPLLAAAHRRASRPGVGLLEALAEAELQAGRPEAAEAVLQRLLQREPRHALAHCRLADLLLSLGEPEPALAHYRQALDTAAPPLAARIHNNLGNLLRLQGELEAARTAFGEALRLQPALAEAAVNLQALPAVLDAEEMLLIRAKQLERRRRFDEAYALLAPEIKGGRRHPVLVDLFAGLCLRLGRWEEPLAAMAGLLGDAELPAGLRRSLLFRQGALLDRLNRSEPAFASFCAAQALRTGDFDPERHRRETDALIGCFDAELLTRLPTGSSSSRPIFIVGMPRSGTTLTEQILSSHPQVCGGGELTGVERCFAELLGPDLPVEAAALRQQLLSLPAAAFRRAAGRYLDELAVLEPHTERVTDKLPGNFRYLGLIRVLFPQALIVHCRRDAYASCFSCFSQDFKQLPYTRELAWLGSYCRDYLRLMEHWRSLPGLITVDYEATVAGLETVSRRLIAAAGLDWHAACLAFHRNPRRVQTASQEQVRRPIYTESVARHLRYPAFLDGLRPWLEN